MSQSPANKVPTQAVGLLYQGGVLGLVHLWLSCGSRRVPNRCQGICIDLWPLVLKLLILVDIRNSATAWIQGDNMSFEACWDHVLGVRGSHNYASLRVF
jgi:hypothetical protein